MFFFFHHCKEWLPLGCWIVEFTLSWSDFLQNDGNYISWNRLRTCKKLSGCEKVWSHSKGRTGWKVVTSLLLVVRVPKHNRPWGHTTKNRRNRETRCRLRFSVRPMAESEAIAGFNEPKSGENLCRNGKPLAPGDLWQCSSTANTLARSNGTQTLPADGIHARTGGQKGEEAACREKAAKAPPRLLPGDPATYGSDSRGEKEPETQLKLRQSRRGNEGEPNTKKRERERGGRREKALTGLSMSALGAGLGPGARQPWRQRGLAGVDDHALITMSQVGQAAKTSNKCTELPC